MFREIRRKAQIASKEECEEILKTAKRGILAVLGDEDYPYTVPMVFVYEDGHIYFHSGKQGHKIDSIRKHDKVSFCVLSDGILEEGEWWYHFTSVVAFGRIHEVTDEELRQKHLRLLGSKYFPTAEYLEKEMRAAPAAAVLDLEIEHMSGKRVKEN